MGDASRLWRAFAPMDIPLEVFPEPVAIVDGGLRLREANAAWREELPGLAGEALAAAVIGAARAVLEGRLGRAEVDAPALEGDAKRYRWTVVAVPGGEAAALVHARRLGAGEDEERARALAEENDLLRTMIDAVPSMMFIKDWDGRFVVANKMLADAHGLTVEQVIRRSQGEIHQHDEETQRFLRADKEVIRTGKTLVIEETVTVASGEVRWLETTKRPMVRRSGEVQALGFCLDITERKLAAEERERAARALAEAAEAAQREAQEKAALAAELDRRLAVIEAQHREIMALSAPILEMGEATIGVPLIGAVDEARAGALTERLLSTIAERQVRHVILDLTGLEAVDTRTADRLLKIAQAIALLGAQAVITGIQPAVAQTMVSLGADISALTTQRTPRDALRSIRASSGA